MSEIHFCKDCKHFNKFNDTCKAVEFSQLDRVSGEYHNFRCHALRSGDTCRLYENKIKPIAPPTTETIKRKSPLFGWIHNLLKG